jgi:uncharacterized membrane protein YoaK (UPF0700 family)
VDGNGVKGRDPAGRNGAEAREATALWTVLNGLTVVSGIIDAVSYIGLGHVFTANMTGNVLILAFAAVGTSGLSVVATSVSLGSFLLGAALAGRLASAPRAVSRQLVTSLMVEAVLLWGAAGASFVLPLATPAGAYSLIVMLGFAMGVRNVVIRRMGIADVSTTVLTGVLSLLAADSVIGTGTGKHWGRRLAQIVSLFAGACLGAFLHNRLGIPVAMTATAVVSLVIAVGAVVFTVARPDRDG